MRRLSLIMTGVLLVLCLFGLSGCSSKIVKEKEVFADIKKADIYCSNFDFTYDSMEIIKRMTDEEEKKDDVYVNFKCHNDDFEYIVECIVRYVLYNEGWFFENYEILKSNYSALTTPNEKQVIDSYYGYMEVVESKEIISSNECVFYGTAVREDTDFCTKIENIIIPFEFTPEEGWIATGVETTHYTYNWKWEAFVGKWEDTAEYPSSYGKINIRKIDQNTVDIDYGINYVTGYSAFSIAEDHYDEGKGEFEMDYITEYAFPFYKVIISNQQGLDIEHFCITPYGLYNIVYEYDGETKLGSQKYVRIN